MFLKNIEVFSILFGVSFLYKMYEFGRFGCNRKLFAQQVVAHTPYLGGTGRVNGPMNMIATTVFCCPNRASLLSMQHNFHCRSENLK